MDILLKILLKCRLIRIKPGLITYWSKKNNLEMVVYSYYNGDFNSRIKAIQELSNFSFESSKEIIIDAIHDKVLAVVLEGIRILHQHKNSEELENEISVILTKWDKKKEELNKNWEVLYRHGVDGKLFDRSEMLRYKELKSLMKKFKGYMAIG